MDIIYSPSLMSADYLHLEKDITILNKYVQLFHADIMDARFAKNLALSPAFIKAVKTAAAHPVEAHLMVTEPDSVLDSVIEAGADIISLHIETVGNQAFRIIRKIKDSGRKAGIVLCPATPVESIRYIAGEIDMLTVMTVDIGYPGQKFIAAMLPKIKEAEKLRKEMRGNFIIQADGGVSPENFRALYEAGTRAFVMGASALFFKGVPLGESCEALYNNFEAKLGSVAI